MTICTSYHACICTIHGARCAYIHATRYTAGHGTLRVPLSLARRLPSEESFHLCLTLRPCTVRRLTDGLETRNLGRVALTDPFLRGGVLAVEPCVACKVVFLPARRSRALLSTRMRVCVRKCACSCTLAGPGRWAGRNEGTHAGSKARRSGGTRMVEKSISAHLAGQIWQHGSTFGRPAEDRKLGR